MDVMTLLELLVVFMQHDQAAQGGPSLQHHAYIVLICLMLTLLPQENLSEEMEEQDIQHLRDVLLDDSLKSEVGAFASADSVPVLVLQLVWNTMTIFCDARKEDRHRCTRDILSTLQRGVLLNIEVAFFDGGIFEGDLGTIASVVHQFLLIFIDTVDEGISWLVKESKASRGKELLKSTEEKAGKGMALDRVSSMGCPKSTAPPDGIGSLLRVWSSCLRHNPPLILGSESSQAHLAMFLRSVGTDSALAGVPSVFVGYMEVLQALAVTSHGARIVFQQLRDENAPPLVSWKRLFETLKNVILMYENQSVGDRRGDVQQHTSHLVLHDADARGLCAFVGVFEYVLFVLLLRRENGVNANDSGLQASYASRCSR